MSTLFISDLHLDESRPDCTHAFLNFLQAQAMDAEALFILGDFFEAWVGDDDDRPLAETLRRALRKVSDAGTPISLLRGNRDFLIGPRFAADCGLHLLADPTVLDLHGTPTLLLHGDLLCTDDVAYQSFRRQVRDPAWQNAFLAQPLDARRAFAAQARAASQSHTQSAMARDESIMDVNADAVTAMLSLYGVTRMIHGHTHRPAIHSLQVNGRNAQRVVLGDWYTQGSVLRVGAEGLSLDVLAY